jgi:hypothetical protein
VDFFAYSCKKISINGSFGSLHGIKMHICAFLFDFALKRNKLLEIKKVPAAGYLSLNL